MATPLLSAIVPRIVEPSLKVTLPVAVEGETVAVNVTVCPYAEGLPEDTKLVVVTTWSTVSTTAEEVLPAFMPSPL